jgi:hypothetical protein
MPATPTVDATTYITGPAYQHLRSGARTSPGSLGEGPLGGRTPRTGVAKISPFLVIDLASSDDNDTVF